MKIIIKSILTSNTVCTQLAGLYVMILKLLRSVAGHLAAPGNKGIKCMQYFRIKLQTSDIAVRGIKGS